MLVQIMLGILVTGSALSIIVFSRVPWWKSEYGIHLMVYMSAVTLLFGIITVRTIIPEGVYNTVSVSFFGVYVVVVWWRLVILIQSQNWSRKRKETKQ
jgi:hypothetical protein